MRPAVHYSFAADVWDWFIFCFMPDPELCQFKLGTCFIPRNWNLVTLDKRMTSDTQEEPVFGNSMEHIPEIIQCQVWLWKGEN